ncbi:MAG: cyclic nucleotide-binding domain-containing protein [Candidatus Methylacidiphilales bacterium]|nr:cyclic nucleotide-binding domain-containing protein [Candidatus Methylacidiphilales bacterium]
MGEPEIIADLTQTGILQYIGYSDLEALKFYGAFGEYGEGEVIITQDQPNDRLYIVVHGALDVLVSHQGKDTKVGEISTGDSIGEVAILEPGEASATVVVRERAILWSMDVEALQQYFEAVPVGGAYLLLGISRLLCRRLRHANQTIIENRIIPGHLGVRSGLIREPIKADNVNSKGGKGLLGGLLGGKKEEPKFNPKVKR